MATDELMVVKETPDTRTDMISDVVQAQHAILIDQRGPGLKAQLQLLNVPPVDALHVLTEAAEALKNSITEGKV